MKNTLLLSTAFVLMLATAAQAQMWPELSPGGMKHVMIGFENNTVSAELDHGVTEPLILQDFGNTHFAPADVLDGMAYNDQYGWLADGAFAPPVGGAFWIRNIASTPGLEIYEGGMRMMRDMHTYAPIFGTDGSADAWKWGGTMTHHWHAATTPGLYEATFEVYVGDAMTGAPLAGYTSDEVTLSWTYVPEPASALLCVAGLALIRRRR